VQCQWDWPDVRRRDEVDVYEWLEAGNSEHDYVTVEQVARQTHRVRSVCNKTRLFSCFIAVPSSQLTAMSSAEWSLQGTTMKLAYWMLVYCTWHCLDHLDVNNITPQDATKQEIFLLCSSWPQANYYLHYSLWVAGLGTVKTTDVAVEQTAYQKHHARSICKVSTSGITPITAWQRYHLVSTIGRCRSDADNRPIICFGKQNNKKCF